MKSLEVQTIESEDGSVEFGCSGEKLLISNGLICSSVFKSGNDIVAQLAQLFDYS